MDDVARNYAWAQEQFDHFIRAWATVAKSRDDPATMYQEFYARVSSRHGEYTRAMAVLAVMRLALQEGSEGVIRIHRTEDQIRGDIADTLAEVIGEIQKRLARTEHLFVVGDVCAEFGVEITGEAA